MVDSGFKFLVIGDPISHSLSPVMHSLFIEHFGISGTYQARQLKLSKLKEAFFSFREEKISGINVTAPLKNGVVQLMDELTDEAKLIGCVNTIKFTEEKIIGHNTDAIGFQASLRADDISLAGKNVLLFGAGGAAKAVLFALIRETCKTIFITNRSIDKAKALVKNASSHFPGMDMQIIPFENEAINAVLGKSHVLINSTTVGMAHSQHQSIIPSPGYVHSDLFVYDLIYRPLQTSLLKHAEQRGAQYKNGLGMLIYQGFESLKFWTDRELILTNSFYKELETSIVSKL